MGTGYIQTYEKNDPKANYEVFPNRLKEKDFYSNGKECQADVSEVESG